MVLRTHGRNAESTSLAAHLVRGSQQSPGQLLAKKFDFAGCPAAGQVVKPIRRCVRAASTSLMVRRKRRANAESDDLPSSFNSSSLQGLPQRLFGGAAISVL